MIMKVSDIGIAIIVLLFHAEAFYVKNRLLSPRLYAKKEIAPGIFEFSSETAGQIPSEIARLVSPEFIKQNNLNVGQKSSRRRDEVDEDNYDDDYDQPRGRPQPLSKRPLSTKTNKVAPIKSVSKKPMVTGRRKDREEREDDDDMSVEELERQLAYETGIGLNKFSDEKGGKKKFETLSDKVMKDTSRFQGFGSSGSSKSSASLTASRRRRDEDDYDDYEEDDYEGYSDNKKDRGNSKHFKNPLMMKDKTDIRVPAAASRSAHTPLTSKRSGTANAYTQERETRITKQRQNYQDDDDDYDEEDDYEDGDDAGAGDRRKAPAVKAVTTKTTERKQATTPSMRRKQTTINRDDDVIVDNDDEEDYDAILSSLQKKYQNKYLFDLDEENDDGRSKSTDQAPSNTNDRYRDKASSSTSSYSNGRGGSRNPTTTTQVTPAKGNNRLPARPAPPTSKTEYKQILNEEFYRMKRPNNTLLELKKQQRYEKQLQKSLQEYEQYQEKMKTRETDNDDSNDLNANKFFPFSLTDSMEEFQESLLESPSKQLYTSEEITFEDVLFNHEMIQNEYYSSDSILNKPQLPQNRKDESEEVDVDDDERPAGVSKNRFKSREFYELVQYLNDNLETMKITTPTKIQEIAIPLLSIGKNTVLHAQTGSGKTLTFLLPLIYLVDSNIDRVQTIILAPSRELVTQINRVCNQLYAGTNFRSVGLIGGANVKSQIRQLREIKPQIIIATPGRLAELVFKHEKISLQGVNNIIIDEADNLLQEPFQNEIKTIIEATPFMKAKLTAMSSDSDAMRRKYVLCLASATANNNPTVTSFMEEYSVKNSFFHPENREEEEGAVVEGSESSENKPAATAVAAKKTKGNYVKAVVNHAGMLPSTITHGIISCPRIKVYEMLKKFLNAKPEINRALIFVNDPYKVETLYQKLISYGFIVAPLHGDSSKDDRKEIFTRLRDGRLRLVVTTELSARGLDIPDVTHVINFELPTDALHYVHRVGRCGRAGKPGIAMNFCTPETKFVIRRFGKQLGTKVFDCEIRGGQVFLKKI